MFPFFNEIFVVFDTFKIWGTSLIEGCELDNDSVKDVFLDYEFFLFLYRYQIYNWRFKISKTIQ